MKFYFKQCEPATAAIRRVNRELRTRMRTLIADESLDADTAVHELRKCVKKLRAVLRLARPALKKPVFKRTDRALAEFARGISGTRDSAVLVATLDGLMTHYHPYVSADGMLPVRQALQDRHVQAMAKYHERLDVRALGAAFEKLERQLDRTGKVKLSRPLLQAAVRDVYRRGRRLQRLLGEDPTTAHSHGLRRQAKYLWYQLRLLKKWMPCDMRPQVRELGRLGEMLGQDNDLAVLVGTLRANSVLCGDPLRAELVNSLAETRRITLLSAGLDLSAGIYARKPGRFARRLFPHA